ncbi:bacillithiol biosynthesis deacetylase BshB1 [Bacillus pakistanensis]|uniref:Bacillithiol biosynthesis deacetylase BshB1 n=1 Tax=Rossellomorea pakistanensis TaxID=992288 RepID=A0ABS2N8Z2_9BACI|nr:bacillithiol biosynthesis deacetylase BshB1 [Bacillus pakistanensis]MBM7584327.1 bacillithiol biosynthesis deacetylase BshB1 [Bacillus pakistanensis]
MKKYGIDILAFGAHADDVEIGMGGSIAKYSSFGKKIVICDLTHAELSSNGTIELRKKEAGSASKQLGVHERITLDIPDRGLFLTEKNIQKIVEVIRRYRPKVVFAPNEIDRHPDHGNASRLIREAFFSAGIRKYQPESPSHKPTNLFFYIINGYHQPDFLIDISDQLNVKLAALKAYESQFEMGTAGVATPLTDGYIESVEARDRLMGKDAGIKYAEGFFSHKTLILKEDLLGE